MEHSLRNSLDSEWKGVVEEPTTFPLFSIGDCHTSYGLKQPTEMLGDIWAWDISPYNYTLCASIENRFCNEQNSNNVVPNGPLQGNECN
jgi:hypothetical protein